MTKKLFWSDPYLTTLDTHVTTVDGNIIMLRETIFYAFSGGQERDSGTIGGYPVLEAAKSGTEIRYLLSSDHGLRIGERVRVKIDWHRRYQLMRLHFAAELILELVYRRLEGVEKIGAHIAADKARLDFTWPESLTPLFSELTAQAQAIIDQDAAIISAFADELQQLRTWEVQGFARIPCGGTHLRRTGEVGRIRLKRNNIGRGKERIEVYVD
ncbi:MAG: alanyl-tRNA editing protein [Desulfuromonas sp.]|nr:MAG: alanyl-tRNA editing protein [Desulfuromonas sp.]